MEINEKDFDRFIGKPLRDLENIDIQHWYPLIDEDKIIINFVSAQEDVFFIKEKPQLTWDDIKIIDNEYAIIRPDIDEEYTKYFTTNEDVISDIEDGMGSEGSRKMAKEMFKLFQHDKLIYFSPELQEYVCIYNEEQFLDIWEKADKEIERKMLNKITNEALSEIPEGLRKAIITKRDTPKDFTKEMYQNIYHNLLRKGSKQFEKKALEYKQKAFLAKIFEKISL